MIIEVVDYSKSINDNERYQQFTTEPEQLEEVSKLTGRAVSNIEKAIDNAEKRNVEFVSFALLNGEEALMVPQEQILTQNSSSDDVTGDLFNGVWVIYDHDNGVQISSIHQDALGAAMTHRFGRIAFVHFGKDINAEVKAWEEREDA